MNHRDTKWNPGMDSSFSLQKCWSGINTILAFVSLLGIIILWITFSAHETFDQQRVVKNDEHIDLSWIAMNRTFILPVHVEIDHITFAEMCCKKNRHIYCCPTEIVNRQVVLCKPLFGYVCRIHFTR